MGRLRTALALAVLLALTLVGGAACSGVGQVTLRVSHAELQERLDRKFPIEKGRSVFKVVLTNPRLDLLDQGDQLQMRLTAQPSALGASLGESDLTIRGGIRYDQKTKAFYLTEPQIVDVDLAHVPERYHDKLRLAVDLAVRELVPVLPVYKLNKNTFKHSLNRAFLKRAWVDDHMLHLEMGL